MKMCVVVVVVCWLWREDGCEVGWKLIRSYRCGGIVTMLKESLGVALDGLWWCVPTPRRA
jgi:hypothetical protein